MPIVNSYINETELYHDLKKMDRDNFSYEGAKALMNYLDDLSEDIGENIEYDPIAFCCEYSEYTCMGFCAANYGDFSPSIEAVKNDEVESELLNWLNDRTTVIEFNGGIIIQDF